MLTEQYRVSFLKLESKYYIRNPAEVASKQDYWNAYKAVIEDVRKHLNNPEMSITVFDINYYYFVEIE